MAGYGQGQPGSGFGGSNNLWPNGNNQSGNFTMAAGGNNDNNTNTMMAESSPQPPHNNQQQTGGVPAPTLAGLSMQQGAAIFSTGTQAGGATDRPFAGLSQGSQGTMPPSLFQAFGNGVISSSQPSAAMNGGTTTTSSHAGCSAFGATQAPGVGSSEAPSGMMPSALQQVGNQPPPQDNMPLKMIKSFVSNGDDHDDLAFQLAVTMVQQCETGAEFKKLIKTKPITKLVDMINEHSPDVKFAVAPNKNSDLKHSFVPGNSNIVFSVVAEKYPWALDRINLLSKENKQLLTENELLRNDNTLGREELAKKDATIHELETELRGARTGGEDSRDLAHLGEDPKKKKSRPRRPHSDVHDQSKQAMEGLIGQLGNQGLRLFKQHQKFIARTPRKAENAPSPFGGSAEGSPPSTEASDDSL